MHSWMFILTHHIAHLRFHAVVVECRDKVLLNLDLVRVLNFIAPD